MRSYLLWSFIALTGISNTTKQEPLQRQPTQYSTPDLTRMISSSPLLTFYKNIVEIPSITGSESPVGEYIIKFLTSQNLTVEKQLITSSQKERFNIYAYTGTNRFPDILLTSHMDTVPPYINYSLHAPTPSREDLMIAGIGTADAKGSVAAIVFAALETIQQDPSASLGLLFDVGEEKSGIGMKFFSDSDLNPDLASYHTVIFGNLLSRAAHSGYPELGRSAISAILPVLQYLDNLQNIQPGDGGLLRSEKFNRSTLNIGVLSGGQAANLVPAYAEASISVRLAAGTPDDTREIILKAVEAVTGGEGGVVVDFGERGGAAPQVLDVVEGFEVVAVNYGTDVPSLVIHGDKKVKRFLYGPGSILVAHGDDEAITIGELERAVEGYKRLIDSAL
ncbi:uncharacterized protein N7484_001332 [Penicillium longicatenatum]|uniref:uncharacterized protein n=1 Tax=Penicillium longicatenatum TaxID=1561947 RepID=UPI00254790E7|nr:uncharacterized protein N7484_001332 [Penicillium longicatenatum]KAJ5657683.1 hypothetical protein N7484_001332 [Penicillium longicatenatum]